MGQVDITRVFSRIEEIRGNARAKLFEAANRLPVSPPILKEIEGQGLIGALSDRLPEGGTLQGKGPILSRLMGPHAEVDPRKQGLKQKEEKPSTKAEGQAQQQKKRTGEDLYSDAGIQI